MTRFAADSGGAGGWGGDSHPGQEPQTTFDLADSKPATDDWINKAGVEDYKFVYGNGQLHLADDYDYSDLASHAGIPADHTGPFALGNIHVDMGKATFEVQANLHAQGLARILKDYCDQAGWKWGGMTDLHGEPIGTGSEFAPVTSFYIALDSDDTVKIAKKRGVLPGIAAVVHVDGTRAYLHMAREFQPEAYQACPRCGMETYHYVMPHDWTGAKPYWICEECGHTGAPQDVMELNRLWYESTFDGVKEWADDHGLTLYGGNDNVLKRHEDLEIDNNYTPEWKNDDEHPLFQNEPDLREPSGQYRCPECNELLPSYRLYLQHREGHDTPANGDDWVDDGKFPELDMDATFPPNTSEPMSFYKGAVSYQPSQMLGADGGDTVWSHAYKIAPPEYRETIQREGLKANYPWTGGEMTNWFMPNVGDFESYYKGHPANLGWDLWKVNHPYSYQMGHGIYHSQDVPPEHLELLDPHSSPYSPQEHSGYETDPDSGEYNQRGKWSSADSAIPKNSAGKSPEGKDILPAPLPFLYDIQEDTITVGQPGQRTSDIPGQFTPGGLIEGTYEPGGKVVVRSATNMPFTVRHMLELWYYTNPHLEVKNVEMQDAEGKSTKLAASSDIGGFITALVGSDPTAFSASRALMRAGGKVYVVGGAVRDALLGKQPKDLDLMVQGLPPEDVQEVLEHLPGHVVKNKDDDAMIGKDFGVFRYRDGNQEIEISLPRSERNLQMGANGRPLPGTVDHKMPVEEDLYRRDFTANAMAVDLADGRLVDPFHGLDDIKSNTLRTLNTKSLADDPLRTIRGLAAMSKHGLIPDRETKEQMAEYGPLVAHLPQERIQAELDKLFQGDNPELALRTAIDTGIMPHIFPEVDKAVGHSQNNPHHELDLGDHLLNVMNRAKEAKPDDPDFALAGLLHDIGKVDSHWTECRDCNWKAHGHAKPCPQCGSDNTSGHFYQLEPGIGQDHETTGAQQAYDRLMALKYPKERAERIRDLIQHHMFPAFTTEKGARKFLNTVGDHADDLLHLRWADQGGKSQYPTDPTLSVDNHRQLVQQVRDAGQATNKSDLAINGRDIMQAGIPQGPEIGKVINHLTDQVLENPELNTREGLLGLVRAWPN